MKIYTVRGYQSYLKHINDVGDEYSEHLRLWTNLDLSMRHHFMCRVILILHNKMFNLNVISSIAKAFQISIGEKDWFVQKLI